MWLYGINRRKGCVPCPLVKMFYVTVVSQVIRESINLLNIKASRQALPAGLSLDLRTLLVASTHRIAKSREIALSYLGRLITSFPSLMCDPPLVFAILEVLTLLRHACENEFTDEVPFSMILFHIRL